MRLEGEGSWACSGLPGQAGRGVDMISVTIRVK